MVECLYSFINGVIMWILISNILLAIGVFLVIGILVTALIKRSDKLIKPRKERKNFQEEKTILTNLLHDIKTNPKNWTYTAPHALRSHQGNIVNDLKGIHVYYSDGTSNKKDYGRSVVIRYNLKNTEDILHQINSPDTITLTIAGRHSEAFIKKAILTLNQRGHELNLFKQQLKNRLENNQKDK